MPFPFWPLMQDPSLYGGQDTMIGNDLPSQGGITGQLPRVYPGFNPPMNPTPDMSMPDVYSGLNPPDPIQDLRMSQLFNPEHFAQDRVNQLMGQMPEHQKPSFMRKLSAALVAGGGNFQQADRILNDPYQSQYQEWEDQFKPAVQAANLERYSNATERQAAQNQLAYETQNRRIQETERHNQETEADRQRRTRAYELRSQGWKPLKEAGGDSVILVNNAGETYDTGLKRSKMDEYDRIQLLGEQRMQQIGAQQEGANQRTRMTVEGANRRNENTVEGANQRSENGKWTLVTIDGKPKRMNTATGDIQDLPGNTVERIGVPRNNSGASGGSASEYQLKQGRLNRAVFLRNERPDLADFIHTENGEVTIDPPTSGLGLGPFGNVGGNGLSPKDYEYMRQTIFGPQMGRSNNVGGSPAGGPPAGWQYMMGPQGKVKVPAEKLEWAKKNGYKPVVP